MEIKKLLYHGPKQKVHIFEDRKNTSTMTTTKP
jgi:hypothetical protein